MLMTSLISTVILRASFLINPRPKVVMMESHTKHSKSQLFHYFPFQLNVKLMSIRTFQRYGLFSSGIGVHYAPSSIVSPTYQYAASGLPIGQRLIPHVFLRAADGRPFEIQDLLPSDTRFKILVFTGNTSDPEQLLKVVDLAEELEGVLQLYAENVAKAFDILTFSMVTKEKVVYNTIPSFLRSHWTK